MDQIKTSDWIVAIFVLSIIMFSSGFVIGELTTRIAEKSPPQIRMYSVAGYVNETTFNMAWQSPSGTNITVPTWRNDSFIVVIGFNVFEKNHTMIQVDYDCLRINPSIEFDAVHFIYTNTSLVDTYSYDFALQGRVVAVDYLTIIFFGHGMIESLDSLAVSGSLEIVVDWYDE